MTGQAGYTTRQAYDIRKLRGKGLAAKPGSLAATTSLQTPPAPSPPSLPSATT